MFRQKENIVRQINRRPLPGFVFFAVLGILMLFGATRWPFEDMKQWPVFWLLFVGVTFLIRYWLLNGRNHRILGIASALAFIAGASWNWRVAATATGWAAIASRFVLVLIAAFLVGCNAEAIGSVWEDFWVRSCPEGHRYDTFSGRRFISARTSAVAARLAGAASLLGMLGILALSGVYVFDLFAYSYLLAALVLLLYLVTIGGVSRRMSDGAGNELSRLEDALEATYERALRPGAQPQEFVSQFQLNLSMQNWLRASARLNIPWEGCLWLALALLAPLVQPYVIHVLRGIEG